MNDDFDQQLHYIIHLIRNLQYTIQWNNLPFSICRFMLRTGSISSFPWPLTSLYNLCTLWSSWLSFRNFSCTVWKLIWIHWWVKKKHSVIKLYCSSIGGLWVSSLGIRHVSFESPKIINREQLYISVPLLHLNNIDNVDLSLIDIKLQHSPSACNPLSLASFSLPATILQ